MILESPIKNCKKIAHFFIYITQWGLGKHEVELTAIRYMRLIFIFFY